MTIGEMLQRMTSAELAGWRAYYAVESFGEEKADLRAGIVAAAVFNANRSSKSKIHQPIDHMPYAMKEKKAAHASMPVEKQVEAVMGSMMLTQKKRKKKD